jgi:formate hydrogenlyase subunit 6/NADH:ubiquinone oxidoreductase subunit I
VSAIAEKDENTEIDMEKCIRCGICHDVCPEQAVRHDSEKAIARIEANVAMTKECMDACAKYLGRAQEKSKCLRRMIKYFKNEKHIAEKTLQKLEEFENG